MISAFSITILILDRSIFAASFDPHRTQNSLRPGPTPVQRGRSELPFGVFGRMSSAVEFAGHGGSRRGWARLAAGSGGVGSAFGVSVGGGEALAGFGDGFELAATVGETGGRPRRRRLQVRGIPGCRPGLTDTDRHLAAIDQG